MTLRTLGTNVAALNNAYAGRWQANHAYLTNDLVLAPDGTLVQRNADGTSRATYDATEAALWTVKAGVSAATAALTDVATTITADGALTIGKHNPVDASAAARAVTLADATGAGKMVTVSKKDSSANTVAITVSHLRDTGTSGTITLIGQYETIALASKADGSWWPITSTSGWYTLPSATSGRNLVGGSTGNNIATDVGSATVVGGGTPQRENVIGLADKTTINTTTPNTVSTGSAADYSAILGGYDNGAGGLMSIIAGAHCYTARGTSHGTISGGSVHKIDAGDYCTISGGTTHTINVTNRATIGGGGSNTINSGGGGGTIAGGVSNTVSGSTSTIGGGSSNTASGQLAVIAGGTTNTASANQAAIMGGESNTASAIYAAVTGGYTNTASGSYSRAGGAQALAAAYGEVAQASGFFAAQGDAQVSRFTARRTTTDATATELRLDGNTQQAQIPVGGVWALSVIVTAKDTGSDNQAMFKLEGLSKRPGTSTGALVGSVTSTTLAASAGAAAWAATLSITTAGIVSVKGTGAAATTVRWVSRIEAVQVA